MTHTVNLRPPARGRACRSTLRPIRGVSIAACAAALLAGLLTGCATSSSDPLKEPTRVDLVIHAQSAVNPNEEGRAAPIVVRVYELKSDTAFNAADFFGLQGNEKIVLADDLVKRDEFLMRPGDTRKIKRLAKPDTVAIGVLAAYRDLGKSVWRTVYKLPTAPDAAWYRSVMPSNKVKLQIELEEHAIKMTEREK